jgi:hypothetical protein
MEHFLLTLQSLSSIFLAVQSCLRVFSRRFFLRGSRRPALLFLQRDDCFGKLLAWILPHPHFSPEDAEPRGWQALPMVTIGVEQQHDVAVPSPVNFSLLSLCVSVSLCLCVSVSLCLSVSLCVSTGYIYVAADEMLQVAADEMDFAYADEFVRALDSSNTPGALTSSRKHQHPCRGEVLPPTPAFQPSLLPAASARI